MFSFILMFVFPSRYSICHNIYLKLHSDKMKGMGIPMPVTETLYIVDDMAFLMHNNFPDSILILLFFSKNQQRDLSTPRLGFLSQVPIHVPVPEIPHTYMEHDSSSIFLPSF